MERVITETGVRATFCKQCGSQVFMVNALYRQRVKDHGPFYCINGHENNFTEESRPASLAEAIATVLGPEGEVEVTGQSEEEHEPRERCTICGKWFKRLNGHLSRSHKDVWRQRNRIKAMAKNGTKGAARGAAKTATKRVAKKAARKGIRRGARKVGQ